MMITDNVVRNGEIANDATICKICDQNLKRQVSTKCLRF